MSDVNEQLVKIWREDTVGRDVCNALTDRLNGILSLEAAEETRPLFDELRARGFDHERVSGLIANACEEVAMLADDIPEFAGEDVGVFAEEEE